MRKIMVLVFVVLLLLSSTHFTASTKSIKVLVDESRVIDTGDIMEEMAELAELFGIDVPIDFDWRYSFENYEEVWGYGIAGDTIREVASLTIKKSGTISYNTLRNYDVLVLASFEESYSATEADAIKQFVENGGGLLFLACTGTLNNSVSRNFDVLFPSETVTIYEMKGRDSVDYIDVTNILPHPVTEGVKKIILNDGVPITSYESGEVIAKTSKNSWADKSGGSYAEKDDDEEEGPFDILVVQTVGRGRAVFFGGAESFCNLSLERYGYQNEILLINAVEWLGEPGGPYKQYKMLNEQARNALSTAKSLYESNLFSQAKEQFDNAIELFEESSEIYPTPESNDGIAEAESYIPLCETGIKADRYFDNAEDLYSKREYEKAVEEYEKALYLYQGIECTERVEECSKKIEKSTALIALREEATQLYSEAEGVLARAPSTFSTAGYKEAKSLFEQAKSTWEEYDDPTQVAACEEKIKYCSEEIARIERTRMIVIVAVVVVIVVVVVLFMRKRKPKVTEAPPAPKEVPEPSPVA